MKNIWKKNQLIITALVVMVGVAGYMNFTETSIKETLNWQKENKKEEKETKEEEEEGLQVETEEEEEVGEAVLTNAESKNMFYAIKLEREQTRAENKEVLTEIINNVNATEDQKNEAIDSIMEMTEFAEKENQAETLLEAKGIAGAIVTMSKEGVDVVVEKKELTEQDIAQIEDIVTRKTGAAISEIVISVAEKNDTTEKK